MRDVQGLENVITSSINGPVYTSQTMLVPATIRVTFTDNLLLTPLFETINNRFVTGRCIVRICLMYRWDEAVAADFKIEIVDRGTIMMSQKTGMDDYPKNTLNTAEWSFVMDDYSDQVQVLLSKTVLDVSKFELLRNSFIKIDRL